MAARAKPLAGKHVLLTRAAADAAPLRKRLEALGAVVLELPTIAIEPLPDIAPVDERLRHLAAYDWIVFSSRHAVRIVFERLIALGIAPPLPTNLKVAAVGPSTASELRERGVSIHCLPEKSTGAALGQAMAALGVRGAEVVLAVGNRSRPELFHELQRAGAWVDQIVVYRTVLPREDSAQTAALQAGEVDLVVLASPSAVQNLAALLAGDLQSLRDTAIVCIGPTTAQAVREVLGVEPTGVAAEPTPDGLVAAIVTAAG